MRKIFRIYLKGASYTDLDIEALDIQEALKNTIEFLNKKGYTTPLNYIVKVELIAEPITILTDSELKN